MCTTPTNIRNNNSPILHRENQFVYWIFQLLFRQWRFFFVVQFSFAAFQPEAVHTAAPTLLHKHDMVHCTVLNDIVCALPHKSADIYYYYRWQFVVIFISFENKKMRFKRSNCVFTCGMAVIGFLLLFVFAGDEWIVAPGKCVVLPKNAAKQISDGYGMWSDRWKFCWIIRVAE